MNFFTVEIKTVSGAVTQVIYERADVKAAIAAHHQTMASALANDNCTEVLSMVINSAGGVHVKDHWKTPVVGNGEEAEQWTAEKENGIDATNFFNYLSGYTEKPKFHHLVVAPFDIRDEFINLINKEIALHKQHGNGFIRAKMNSLTDKDLMMKLYEASIAGVKIELIIRGICWVSQRKK